MNARYQVYLEKYSLRKFKCSLQVRELIPSRKSLKDDLAARFRILENCGIANLQELIDRLKTKAKIEQCSQETSLSAPYLKLLKREARSYLSKPIRLDKFPGVQAEYLERLEAENIRNTRQFFLEAQAESARERLSKATGIPSEALLELLRLSDLYRIYGVGPVFARLIYEVGVRSVQGFVEYRAEDFIRVYEEHTQKRADFGVGEIHFSLELAKELDKIGRE